MPLKVLLSCTTFFREKFTIDNFIQNFSTVFDRDKNIYDELDSVIIVNEYSPDNIKEFSKHKNIIEEIFSKAIFIQKGKDQQGQAHSLNIILNACENMDYHIQWEEGWICTKPFYYEVIGLLEHSNYQQIGLTNDWCDSLLLLEKKLNTSSSVFYRELMIDPRFNEHKLLQLKKADDQEIANILATVNLNIWPLYSLRPGVNRVSFVKELPLFNTYEKLWPVRFEYLYAYYWFIQGGTKAMLASPRSYRALNKVSSYRTCSVYTHNLNLSIQK